MNHERQSSVRVPCSAQGAGLVLPFLIYALISAFLFLVIFRQSVGSCRQASFKRKQRHSVETPLYLFRKLHKNAAMFETSQDDLLLFPSEGSDDAFFPAESLGGGGQSLAEALLPLVESPSPPLNPWLCSTRYKTELCSRYAESGTCKYAERCQFAHGLHDLHVPSRHPKYKTELCRSFHTAGYCMYGSRCLFVHSLKEQRPVRLRRRNVPCRTYRAFGVCPFGTRCHFLHVEGGSESDSAEEKTWHPPARTSEWKPRGALCRTFSAFGFCLYGTRCRFQHGLPNTVKGLDLSQTPWSPQVLGRALSPDSDMQLSSPPSSSASSPQSLVASPAFPDDSGPVTSPEVVANNAFTFSSQHLNDLLLPLAFRLQQLEQVSNLSAARLDQPLLP